MSSRDISDIPNWMSIQLLATFVWYVILIFNIFFLVIRSSNYGHESAVKRRNFPSCGCTSTTQSRGSRAAKDDPEWCWILFFIMFLFFIFIFFLLIILNRFSRRWQPQPSVGRYRWKLLLIAIAKLSECFDCEAIHLQKTPRYIYRESALSIYIAWGAKFWNSWTFSWILGSGVIRRKKLRMSRNSQESQEFPKVAQLSPFS